MKIVYTLFVMLIFIVMPVHANQQHIEVEKFKQLYEQGLYQQALNSAILATQSGNKNAELHFLLAELYNNGKGELGRDEQKAAFYFEQAILFGSFDAASQYGNALVNGADFPQDCQMGLKYLYLAHYNGILNASALLGSNYFHGHCVQQNFGLAKEFLAVPVEQENAVALNVMAGAYFYGSAVDNNMQKAYNYWLKAAEKGSCNAQYSVATLYDNGIYVKVDLKEAFTRLETSHSGGCIISTVGLANMYYLGRHVAKDQEKAYKLYDQASKAGDLEALSMMGIMLVEGIGVDKDQRQGLELLQKAARRGDVEALYHLGTLYFDGNYVEQSYVKASEYYQASLANPFSRFNLGYMYEFGLGLEQNLERAEELYIEALRQGNIQSTKALALWHIRGKYYSKDHSVALTLLKDGSITNDYEVVALYAMLLACSFDNDVRNTSYALDVITQHKKLRNNKVNVEIKLAESVALGALGEFESAQNIVNSLEHIYISEQYTQQHIQNWYARERFLEIKQDIDSFNSCSW